MQSPHHAGRGLRQALLLSLWLLTHVVWCGVVRCSVAVSSAYTNIPQFGAEQPCRWGKSLPPEQLGAQGEHQSTGHLFGPLLIQSRNPRFLHAPFLGGAMGDAPFQKFFVPYRVFFF